VISHYTAKDKNEQEKNMYDTEYIYTYHIEQWWYKYMDSRNSLRRTTTKWNYHILYQECRFYADYMWLRKWIIRRKAVSQLTRSESGHVYTTNIL